MSSIGWPDHLFSLEEWDALPEDTSRRFELVEGLLQMSPRPSPAHQFAVAMLTTQLNAALVARGWVAIPDVDIVLVETFPPVLRAPDIVVVSMGTGRAKRFSAADVQVAIEIVSPGSARIDRIAKLADYAEAGIAQYWIIDIDGPVTLDAFRLADGGYRPVLVAATGTDSAPCASAASAPHSLSLAVATRSASPTSTEPVGDYRPDTSGTTPGASIAARSEAASYPADAMRHLRPADPMTYLILTAG